MAGKLLDKVYGAKCTDETRALYDDWAASYDAEIAENGYATPRRCAEALAGFAADKSAPVLDFGCGTGLSGLALRAAGCDVIDGLDLSENMLDQARAKGIYRSLDLIGPDDPLPFAPGAYAAIAAIGVIGVGAAPLDTFDLLMNGLGRGGLFVFSFNDHALQHPEYDARVNAWVDPGAARLLFREHGDHLPGKNIKSMVYVIEKN